MIKNRYFLIEHLSKHFKDKIFERLQLSVLFLLIKPSFLKCLSYKLNFSFVKNDYKCILHEYSS